MFVERTTRLKSFGKKEYLEQMRTGFVPTVINIIGRPVSDVTLKVYSLKDLKKTIEI